MDGLIEFLETLRRNHLVLGNFRSILHIVIGRTIRTLDDQIISAGVTWRVLSKLLQELRWDKELVRELGFKPDDFSPRDRQRYWFQAMMNTKLTGSEVSQAADEFSKLLVPLGYLVGPAPRN